MRESDILRHKLSKYFYRCLSDGHGETFVVHHQIPGPAHHILSIPRSRRPDIESPGFSHAKYIPKCYELFDLRYTYVHLHIIDIHR